MLNQGAVMLFTGLCGALVVLSIAYYTYWSGSGPSAAEHLGQNCLLSLPEQGLWCWLTGRANGACEGNPPWLAVVCG
ncbi:hypothetical protein J4Q44_G00044780 [Coregonus suidteri]|uniref:Uncharacterized protein n=1 Tax=Coregonus suidteri TaxID=861788 RepID=A0AAN8MF07_9TELE